MAKYEGDTLNNGYAEYMCKVKPTAKVIIARILIVVFTVLVNILMGVLTLGTIPTVSFTLFAIFVFAAWFLWQFTKIEYEYVIATGELELCKIYGARIRKKVLCIKTSDISAIITAKNISDISKGVENILYACEKTDETAIALLYNFRNNVKRILVISAPQKTLTALKYFRRSAFVNVNM